MGTGVVLEPLVVIVLLFGGTWINRVTDCALSGNHTRRSSLDYVRVAYPDSLESGYTSLTPEDELLSSRCTSPPAQILDDQWSKRHIAVFGTALFQERLLSRLLRKLPFLVECWYWALVYWVS